MHKIMKNRLALSTVITTLIILVVSVLLAGVVTYFAINVVSTRVQQESLAITHTHIWVDASGNAIGALVITNTGGRDVVINQIAVRGQPIMPSGAVYYPTADTTPATDLTKSSATALSAGTASTSPIVLASGKSEQVFIVAPGSVSAADIGASVAFTIFTAQASYYSETNVQASTTSLA